jgi:hypothetical protein
VLQRKSDVDWLFELTEIFGAEEQVFPISMKKAKLQDVADDLEREDRAASFYNTRHGTLDVVDGVKCKRDLQNPSY